MLATDPLLATLTPETIRELSNDIELGFTAGDREWSIRAAEGIVKVKEWLQEVDSWNKGWDRRPGAGFLPPEPGMRKRRGKDRVDDDRVGMKTIEEEDEDDQLIRRRLFKGPGGSDVVSACSNLRRGFGDGWTSGPIEIPQVTGKPLTPMQLKMQRKASGTLQEDFMASPIRQITSTAESPSAFENAPRTSTSRISAFGHRNHAYDESDEEDVGTDDVYEDGQEYCGTLPKYTVEKYEARIEQIKDEIEELDVEGLKGKVLSYRTGIDNPLTSSSAIITATTLQLLPPLHRLMKLLSAWAIRLAVLKIVPVFIRWLDNAKQALEAGYIAIRHPAILNGTQKLDEEIFIVMQESIQQRVAVAGRIMDSMLDALEGREDVLPDKWIGELEDIEEGVGTWEMDAERVVLEGRLGAVTRAEELRVEREKMQLVKEAERSAEEAREDADAIDGVLEKVGEVERELQEALDTQEEVEGRINIKGHCGEDKQPKTVGLGLDVSLLERLGNVQESEIEACRDNRWSGDCANSLPKDGKVITRLTTPDPEMKRCRSDAERIEQKDQQSFLDSIMSGRPKLEELQIEHKDSPQVFSLPEKAFVVGCEAPQADNCLHGVNELKFDGPETILQQESSLAFTPALAVSNVGVDDKDADIIPVPNFVESASVKFSSSGCEERAQEDSEEEALMTPPLSVGETEIDQKATIINLPSTPDSTQIRAIPASDAGSNIEDDNPENIAKSPFYSGDGSNKPETSVSDFFKMTDKSKLSVFDPHLKNTERDDTTKDSPALFSDSDNKSVMPSAVQDSGAEPLLDNLTDDISYIRSDETPCVPIVASAAEDMEEYLHSQSVNMIQLLESLGQVEDEDLDGEEMKGGCDGDDAEIDESSNAPAIQSLQTVKELDEKSKIPLETQETSGESLFGQLIEEDRFLQLQEAQDLPDAGSVIETLETSPLQLAVLISSPTLMKHLTSIEEDLGGHEGGAEIDEEITSALSSNKAAPIADELDDNLAVLLEQRDVSSHLALKDDENVVQAKETSNVSIGILVESAESAAYSHTRTADPVLSFLVVPAAIAKNGHHSHSAERDIGSDKNIIHNVPITETSEIAEEHGERQTMQIIPRNKAKQDPREDTNDTKLSEIPNVPIPFPETNFAKAFFAPTGEKTPSPISKKPSANVRDAELEDITSNGPRNKYVVATEEFNDYLPTQSELRNTTKPRDQTEPAKCLQIEEISFVTATESVGSFHSLPQSILVDSVGSIEDDQHSDSDNEGASLYKNVTSNEPPGKASLVRDKYRIPPLHGVAFDGTAEFPDRKEVYKPKDSPLKVAESMVVSNLQDEGASFTDTVTAHREIPNTDIVLNAPEFPHPKQGDNVCQFPMPIIKMSLDQVGLQEQEQKQVDVGEARGVEEDLAEEKYEDGVLPSVEHSSEINLSIGALDSPITLLTPSLNCYESNTNSVPGLFEGPECVPSPYQAFASCGSSLTTVVPSKAPLNFGGMQKSQPCDVFSVMDDDSLNQFNASAPSGAVRPDFPIKDSTPMLSCTVNQNFNDTDTPTTDNAQSSISSNVMSTNYRPVLAPRLPAAHISHVSDISNWDFESEGENESEGNEDINQSDHMTQTTTPRSHLLEWADNSSPAPSTPQSIIVNRELPTPCINSSLKTTMSDNSNPSAEAFEILPLATSTPTHKFGGESMAKGLSSISEASTSQSLRTEHAETVLDLPKLLKSPILPDELVDSRSRAPMPDDCENESVRNNASVVIEAERNTTKNKYSSPIARDFQAGDNDLRIKDLPMNDLPALDGSHVLSPTIGSEFWGRQSLPVQPFEIDSSPSGANDQERRFNRDNTPDFDILPRPAVRNPNINVRKPSTDVTPDKRQSQHEEKPWQGNSSPSEPLEPPREPAIGMDQRINDLLMSLPHKVKLTASNLQKLNEQSGKKITQAKPWDISRSSIPAPSVTSERSGGSGTAFAKISSRRHQYSTQGDIKCYHLHRNDEQPPMKLYVRLVGNARLVCRVGGGWSDLEEYLKEWAAHHGSKMRAVSESLLEVQDMPPSKGVPPHRTLRQSASNSSLSRCSPSPAAASRSGSPAPCIAQRSVSPAFSVTATPMRRSIAPGGSPPVCRRSVSPGLVNYSQGELSGLQGPALKPSPVIRGGHNGTAKRPAPTTPTLGTFPQRLELTPPSPHLSHSPTNSPGRPGSGSGGSRPTSSGSAVVLRRAGSRLSFTESALEVGEAITYSPEPPKPLKLAGPRAKNKNMTPENQAWVEGMIGQVRKASSEHHSRMSWGGIVYAAGSQQGGGSVNGVDFDDSNPIVEVADANNVGQKIGEGAHRFSSKEMEASCSPSGTNVVEEVRDRKLPIPSVPRDPPKLHPPRMRGDSTTRRVFLKKGDGAITRGRSNSGVHNQ